MKNGLIAGGILSLAMMFAGPAVADDAGQVTIKNENISPVELTYKKSGERSIQKNGTSIIDYQASAHVHSHYPTLNNLADVFKATEIWADGFCKSLNDDKGERWMAVDPASLKLGYSGQLQYKMEFTFQCYGR